MTPAELRALLAAATPGPWTHGDIDGRFDLHQGDPKLQFNLIATCGELDDGGFDKEADALLCAALRNLAPLLVDLWESMLNHSGEQKALEALRDAKL